MQEFSPPTPLNPKENKALEEGVAAAIDLQKACDTMFSKIRDFLAVQPPNDNVGLELKLQELRLVQVSPQIPNAFADLLEGR